MTKIQSLVLLSGHGFWPMTPDFAKIFDLWPSAIYLFTYIYMILVPPVWAGIFYLLNSHK